MEEREKIRRAQGEAGKGAAVAGATEREGKESSSAKLPEAGLLTTQPSTQTPSPSLPDTSGFGIPDRFKTSSG